MQKYLFIIFFTFTLGVFSQNPQNQFTSDLDFIYDNLKKTPSYKTQKNQQKKLDSIYLDLKQETAQNDFSYLEYLVKLYSLTDVLQDYHNQIDLDLSSVILSDSNFATNKAFPVSKMNLDSLTSVLTNSEAHHYQGIYSYKDLLQVAVVECNSGLQGIILESKLPQWKKGQVLFYLIPKEKDRFRIITGSFKGKTIISSIDYFKDGSFLAVGWTKEKTPDSSKHYKVIQKDKHFILEEITTKATYIKISSLTNSSSLKQQADVFFNQIEKQDLKETLLVDLRNNPGGNLKNAKGLLKLLKKYKGKIYVLVNFYTVSAGERLALLLKQQYGATLVGDRTKGELSYSRNYSTSLYSPSSLLKINFTDLRDNWKRFLPYEGIGITPDIFLDSNKDWIIQILEIEESL